MISSELTNENVSGLLVISDRHNANKLKQICCEYICRHYSEVIQTSQYREIRSEVENILNQQQQQHSQRQQHKHKSDTHETNSQSSKKQRNDTSK
jgi:hypothetical protein